MEIPTDEQKAILDSSARVRVVLAAPGSGKTWLVGQTIKKELDNNPKTGIAALSFTNVAGNEIRRTLGHELSHPHFVGTIDSFVYRFIVRPFVHMLFTKGKSKSFRLIPDCNRPQFWQSQFGNTPLDVEIGKTKKGGSIRCNLFDAVFIGSDNISPVIAWKNPLKGFEILPAPKSKTVYDAKQRLWNGLGWLSHSDVAFLSTQLIQHEQIGPCIIGILANRFSFIVLDELQDTGWFLGKTMEKLAEYSSFKALFVGDPDQAIYEFNGAQPCLCRRFLGLPGATELPLRISRRCPKKICNIAKSLSVTQSDITPYSDKDGDSIITYYNQDDELVPLWKTLSSCVCNAKVLTRKNRDVNKLKNRGYKHLPSIGSPVFVHLNTAVVNFRLSKNDRAISVAEVALAKACFGDESYDNIRMAHNNVDYVDWRLAAQQLLLQANSEVDNETIYEWSKRMKDLLAVIVKQLNPSFNMQIKLPQKTKTQNILRADYLPNHDCSNAVEVSTIHAVKGETHDLTVLYYPPNADECPSGLWWSDNMALQEEQRIAVTVHGI